MRAAEPASEAQPVPARASAPARSECAGPWGYSSCKRTCAGTALEFRDGPLLVAVVPASVRHPHLEPPLPGAPTLSCLYCLLRWFTCAFVVTRFHNGRQQQTARVRRLRTVVSWHGRTTWAGWRATHSAGCWCHSSIWQPWHVSARAKLGQTPGPIGKASRRPTTPGRPSQPCAASSPANPGALRGWSG